MATNRRCHWICVGVNEFEIDTFRTLPHCHWYEDPSQTLPVYNFSIPPEINLRFLKANMTSSTASEPSLAGLPTEIHLIVYGYVFDSTGFSRTLRDLHVCSRGSTCRPRCVPPAMHTFKIFIANLRSRTYLLCASRQIMREAFDLCNKLVQREDLNISQILIKFRTDLSDCRDIRLYFAYIDDIRDTYSPLRSLLDWWQVLVTIQTRDQEVLRQLRSLNPIHGACEQHVHGTFCWKAAEDKLRVRLGLLGIRPSLQHYCHCCKRRLPRGSYCESCVLF